MKIKETFITQKYSNKPLRLLKKVMSNPLEMTIDEDYRRMFIIVMTDNLINYNTETREVDPYSSFNNTTIQNRRQYSGYALTPNLINSIVRIMLNTKVDQRVSIIVMSSMINQLINEHYLSVEEIMDRTQHNTVLSLYRDLTGINSHPTSHKIIFKYQMDKFDLSFKSSLRSERAMMTMLTSNNDELIQSLINGLNDLDPERTDLADTRKLYDKLISFL